MASSFAEATEDKSADETRGAATGEPRVDGAGAGAGGGSPSTITIDTGMGRPETFSAIVISHAFWSSHCPFAFFLFGWNEKTMRSAETSIA